jgi:hypothetical protein
VSEGAGDIRDSFFLHVARIEALQQPIESPTPSPPTEGQ